MKYRNMSKSLIRAISVIIIIVFMILTPFIINLVYMLGRDNVQPNTVFDASDLLVIYSACLSVIGVFFSIQYAQSNYRDDVRQRVLPFISITPLLSTSKVDLFEYYLLHSTLTQNDIDEVDITENYNEYKMNQFYFIVNSSGILLRTKLTNEQRVNIETGLSKLTMKDESGVYYSDVYYIPLEAENVGNGAAINLEIGLSKEREESPITSIPSTFKVNEKIYIGLYFDFSVAPQRDTTYILKFSYQDIYRNNYTQSFKYTAKVNKTILMDSTSIQIGGSRFT